jgi:protocatechuate 3,4-dioxygenase beta subunit
LNRRTLIKGLAALTPLIGMRRLAAAEPPPPARTCRLITQDIAGPYAVEGVPMRADITEGQPGTPLRLDFRVVDSFGCAPLPGALVSIWHANAAGIYSGVQNVMLSADQESTGEKIDTRGQTFLRGMQRTDANGQVTFSTIFPGWYFPRPVHLHVMVVPPDYGEVATTQLYFPDAVCDQAYQAEPYAARGPSPARSDPSVDSPTDSSDAADLWLHLRREADGWVASHNLGVTFYGDSFGELPAMYRQS